MSMSKLEEQIQRIQEKLALLVKKQDGLERENRLLKTELEEEQGERKRAELELASLRNKLNIAALSTGDWNDRDKKAFEKQLQQYIRNIDQCIALLSK